ncbi:74e9f90b-360a-42d4-b3ca-0cae8e4f2dbb [Sclerotinia trifoliorum]|uniref:74e9f90b-360a-42d4-b3ca-0cae8e4f2dbb n=1 Tax=Sclerotinia trifoliorum TaxID=28548 RepID=A0A8H2VSJ2_9HELO|nr:74e9f90b-360a-42d4-b3ca-0cae8e4f2dbb [Sclerotinia trifoliorum]
MENRRQYGVLKVTLYEGSGISMVDQYSDIFRRLEHEPSHECEEALQWGFLIVDAVSGPAKSSLWAGKDTSYRFEVSRVAELTVSLYLRNPQAFMGHHDFSLGAVKLHHPWANEVYKYDKINVTASLGQESYAAVPKWLDVQNGAGKILIGIEFKERKHPSLGYFHPSPLLGEQSASKSPTQTMMK